MIANGNKLKGAISSTGHKRSVGFTLIELMIVIAIIGLLASMIAVGWGRVQSLGRDSRRIADMHQVRTALELYFSQNRRYPVFATVTTWDHPSTATFSDRLVGAGLGIRAIPVDPLNRGDFLYAYISPSPHTTFVLRALLENNNNPALRDSPHDLILGMPCGPIFDTARNIKGTSGTDSFYCLAS